MKVFAIIIIFLIIGGLMIARSYNLNLKKPDHMRTFFGKFSVWLVQLGKNTINTVGYALRLNWLPQKPNETTD
jgi:hypothetical protein